MIPELTAGEVKALGVLRGVGALELTAENDEDGMAAACMSLTQKRLVVRLKHENVRYAITTDGRDALRLAIERGEGSTTTPRLSAKERAATMVTLREYTVEDPSLILGVRTVGELRRALQDMSDDTPVVFAQPCPASAAPDSFEDEYGPGTIMSLVQVVANEHWVLLSKGSSAGHDVAATGGAR